MTIPRSVLAGRFPCSAGLMVEVRWTIDCRRYPDQRHVFYPELIALNPKEMRIIGGPLVGESVNRVELHKTVWDPFIFTSHSYIIPLILTHSSFLTYLPQRNINSLHNDQHTLYTRIIT